MCYQTPQTSMARESRPQHSQRSGISLPLLNQFASDLKAQRTPMPRAIPPEPLGRLWALLARTAVRIARAEVRR